MAIDLLVFGPHADDIEIGLGGTIARHTAEGATVGLCDLTAGELSSNGTPEERKREAERAARVLGAAWRENLGWPDGGIAATPPMIRSAVDLIRRARPRRDCRSLLGRSTSRPRRGQRRAAPRRVHERPAPLRDRRRRLARRLGLLLLHQRRRVAVLRRRCLGSLSPQARGAGLLSQPVHARRPMARSRRG